MGMCLRSRLRSLFVDLFGTTDAAPLLHSLPTIVATRVVREMAFYGLADLNDILRTLGVRSTARMALVAFFLGVVGVDRLLLGERRTGAVKGLTLGGLGLWWLYDLFTVSERTRQYNGGRVLALLDDREDSYLNEPTPTGLVGCHFREFMYRYK